MSKKNPHVKRARIKLRKRMKPYGHLGKWQYLDVSVGKGYVSFTIYPNGIGPIYIPRNQFVQILKWMIPLVKEMDSSLDPVLAMRDQEKVKRLIEQDKRANLRAPRRRKRSAR